MRTVVLTVLTALLIAFTIAPAPSTAQQYNFIEIQNVAGQLVFFSPQQQDNLKITWNTEANEEIDEIFTIPANQHVTLTSPTGTFSFYFMSNGGLPLTDTIIDSDFVKLSNGGFYAIPAQSMSITVTNTEITFKTSDGSSPVGVILKWANDAGPMRLTFQNGQSVIARPSKATSLFFRDQHYAISSTTNLIRGYDGWYRLPAPTTTENLQVYLPALSR